MNQQPKKLPATRSNARAAQRRTLPLLPGLDPSRSQTFWAIAYWLLIVLLGNGIGLSSPLNSDSMNSSSASGGDTTEMMN